MTPFLVFMWGFLGAMTAMFLGLMAWGVIAGSRSLCEYDDSWKG